MLRKTAVIFGKIDTVVLCSALSGVYNYNGGILYGDLFSYLLILWLDQVGHVSSWADQQTMLAHWLPTTDI